MAEITGKKSCKQITCKVAEDGKCLEGLELSVCPHFYLDSEEVVESSKGISKTPVQTISLFTGRELPLKDVTIVTNRYRARFVMIIGDSDAGKSTLLTSLFDLFQIGYFGDFSFAGSITQVGFEERCHSSRTTSGRRESDTPRTKVKEFNFLHLGVKRSDSKHGESVSHLLLSDMSGEKFSNARDSSEVMKSLELISSMDFIIVMLDGEKIANKKLRTATLISMQTFIQKALEEGVFTKGTKIKITVSKWDCLYKDKSFDFKMVIEDYFNKSFKSKLASIEFHWIISRSEISDGVFESGFGLTELLDEWTQPSSRKVNRIEYSVEGNRFFDKYNLR